MLTASVVLLHVHHILVPFIKFVCLSSDSAAKTLNLEALHQFGQAPIPKSKPLHEGQSDMMTTLDFCCAHE